MSLFIWMIFLFTLQLSRHIKNIYLTTVFQRLHDAGLTLRGRKCRIGMTSVTYLGHVFSANSMSTDPTKVQAVQAWPAPTDVKGLRQFLGLSSYYRRYIQDFSKVAAPLHAVTQKNACLLNSIFDPQAEIDTTTCFNLSPVPHFS